MRQSDLRERARLLPPLRRLFWLDSRTKTSAAGAQEAFGRFRRISNPKRRTRRVAQRRVQEAVRRAHAHHRDS